MLLTVRNVTKSYGAINVLSDISFVINAHERIGIVGPNGVGKSTLLRLLTGQEELDTGSITFDTSVEYGYLPQTTPQFHGHTINDLILEAVGNLRQLEERMHQLEKEMAGTEDEHLGTLLDEYAVVSTRFQERGGYEMDYKIDAVLQGLHLAYLERTREVKTLSGGEKARLGLAVLLLRAPDILLLDEPTNHLDVASLEWLEMYLSNYQGAALMVSHDRQFLNRAVNRIFEIDEYTHQLKSYEGNYDAYVATKTAERVRWEEEYERQQEEIQDLRKRIKDAKRAVARTYHRPARDNDKSARHFFEENVQRSSSSKMHAAEVLLERIEANPITKPADILRINSQFTAEPLQSKEVIHLEHLSKHFGNRYVLRDLNAIVGPGARIMLVGPNGAGKTTLLRLIMGLEHPDAGNVHIVGSAYPGYLPQVPFFNDVEKTVIETYRYGQVGYEGEFIGRLLGYGLFHLEDMEKQVKQLSAGQRRKLEIARLMARKPNILLLDEPTNYISLDVLEALETAILDFPGPVIAISHDRWFIQRFGGEIWTLDNETLAIQTKTAAGGYRIV